MVKRYDKFGDEALVDSWPVYVSADDYDALRAEVETLRARLRDYQPRLTHGE